MSPCLVLEFLNGRDDLDHIILDLYTGRIIFLDLNIVGLLIDYGFIVGLLVLEEK